MTTETIRVGIIGASIRNGRGRDAHIPALRAIAARRFATLTECALLRRERT